MSVWAIEASCFGVTEQQLFDGELPGVIEHLKQLVKRGYQIGAAYQLDVPAIDGAPRASVAGDNTQPSI